MKNTPAPQRRGIGKAIDRLLHRDHLVAVGAAPRPRRSVRDVITEAFGKDAYDKATSSSTVMARALSSKPVYQGTVDKATVQRRRAANKRARAARRIHRVRAGR